ncbi:hypothetical protein H0A36_01110 [Endozoicomonas sp. SM1973]|uniref:Uncharacterized protein n=1 Tax=Spartinivicinus marinus TaxID=2994442 RepID=A0A853IAY8_9GAMM|nr:hypothetical protein [Spartinivicinus marinus]MCX4026752.1 hypothetical protein [Spartinivicinus marinus]NYZ64586.1 hypothetical protein [Spartinivicinus marinus]
MPDNGISRISSGTTNQQSTTSSTPVNQTPGGMVHFGDTKLAIKQLKPNKFNWLFNQAKQLNPLTKLPSNNTNRLNKLKPAPQTVTTTPSTKTIKIPQNHLHKIESELISAFTIYAQKSIKHRDTLRNYFITGTNSPNANLGNYFKFNDKGEIVLCLELSNDKALSNPTSLAKLLSQILEGHRHNKSSSFYRTIHDAVANKQSTLSKYLTISFLGKIEARTTVKQESITEQTPQTDKVVSLKNKQEDRQRLLEQLNKQLKIIQKIRDNTLNIASEHDYFVSINNKLFHLFRFQQEHLSPTKKLECPIAKSCINISLSSNADEKTLDNWLKLNSRLDEEYIEAERRLNSLNNRLETFQEAITDQNSIPAINVDALTAFQQAKLALANTTPSLWHKLKGLISNNPQPENDRVRNAKQQIDRTLKILLHNTQLFEQIKNKQYIRILVAAELTNCLDLLKKHPTFLGKELTVFKANEYKSFEKLLLALKYLE